ncbi:MAG: integral rane protein MviN [Fibrobacteria bacterium]|jgi:putative peptidoglycan lipid II flippase|nr:integral rane protein MviN [Fibrobacteria bacterium]
MNSFTHSTATITLFTVLGLGLGFLSNLVIAAVFGVGSEMDAYVAATTLPTLLAAVFGGAISAAFVPLLAEYQEKNPAEAPGIARAFLFLALGLGFLLAGAGILFSGVLSRWLAPGLAGAPLELSAGLMRWLLPGLVLALANEALSALYYSGGRFFMPLLIKVIGPLITLLFVAWLAPALSVRSLVLATLATGALQTLLLLAGLGSRASKPLPRARPSLSALGPALRTVVLRMLPLVLGFGITRLVPVIDRWIASGMPYGSISTLAYANRLFLVISPVLTTGISLAGFVRMSRLAARDDSAGLRDSMERSLRALMFFSVPAAVLLCAFSEPLIRILFERGAFSREDAAATAGLFSLYALSLPATAAGTIIGQGFYVLKDTRTPLVVGILEITLYGFLCGVFSPFLGLTALPLSFNLYFYASVLALGLLLARRAGFAVFPLFMRPFGLALMAAGLALVPALSLRLLFPDTDAWALGCLGLAFVAYFWIQKLLFRNREADRILGILRRKIHA